MDDWQNSIVTRYSDLEGHVAISYPQTYQRKISIYQIERGLSQRILALGGDNRIGPINTRVEGNLELRASGRITYQWDLNYAYPIAFNQETLSDGAKGTLSQISVDFSYRNWTGSSPEKKNREITVDGSVSSSTDIVNQATNRVYKAIDKVLGRFGL